MKRLLAYFFSINCGSESRCFGVVIEVDGKIDFV